MKNLNNHIIGSLSCEHKNTDDVDRRLSEFDTQCMHRYQFRNDPELLSDTLFGYSKLYINRKIVK